MRKIYLSILIIVLFFSCKSFKHEISDSGDKYQAFENVIVDYYHTNKNYIKKYNVFEIEDNSNPSVYNLNIMPRDNFYYLSIKDSIGASSAIFPTNFKEYRGKLFVWNDRNKFINERVINKLHSFGKLDSISLKYELGIYSSNDTIGVYPKVPLFKVDETLKEVYYIICKKNISKYYKAYSQKKVYNLKIECP